MERKPAKDFRDLIVWQKAHQFVLSTYLTPNSLQPIAFSLNNLSNYYPITTGYVVASFFER